MLAAETGLVGIVSQQHHTTMVCCHIVFCMAATPRMIEIAIT